MDEIGERWHASLGYRHSSMNLVLRHNPASFYDLVGPTRVSRKGDGLHFDWRRSLIRDTPRTMDLTLALNGWAGLERLPDAQNVSISPGFDKLVNGALELHDENLRSSIGAVDREKGWQWRLGAATNEVRFMRAGVSKWRDFPSFEGSGDAGTPLPLRNASLWLRTAAGYSPGDRSEPFANFFFGGFGNNYLDAHGEKRYREYYSLPGFAINELNGRTFGRTMLEGNLPPVVFESVGTPAFHLAWLRPALFATALWTDPSDSAFRTRYNNLGAQADLRFTVLHWYEMTLSVGYAVGYKGTTRSGDEWMVSLKIM